MKEFLSNAWVVSIISGILVFFFTNSIIMLQNKRKHKKQINDANTMIINRLRGYVVDNGLPEKEILNAVKSSTAREYNVKYGELLSNKELCEELITDIIGNTYISNDNKIKYIDMLQKYLKSDNNLDNSAIHNVKVERNTDRNKYLIKRKKGLILKEMFFSLIPAVITIMSVFLSSYDKTEIDFSKFDIYSIFIEIIFVALIPIIIGVLLSQIKDISKEIKKMIKCKKR